MTELTHAEYDAAVRHSEGWCTFCLAFTTPLTPPHARRSTCSACQHATVYGAQRAYEHAMFAVADEPPAQPT